MNYIPYFKVVSTKQMKNILIPNYKVFSIISFNKFLGTNPTFVVISSPFLNIFIVGIFLTPYSEALSEFSSISILTILHY